MRSLNFAVSGTRPSHWLRNQPKTGKQNDLRPTLDQMVGMKPSIVLMTLGANELLGNPPCLAKSSCVRNSVGTVERDMTELFKHLTSTTKAKIYVTAYYALSKDIVGAVPSVNNALLRASKADGVPANRVFIVDPPNFTDHQCHDKKPWLSNKDIVCVHPNETGHQKLADKVLASIRTGRGIAKENAGAVSLWESASWAAQAGGRVAVEVSSVGVFGPAPAVFKFVRKAGGGSKATVAAAKSRTATVRTTLRFRDGVATTRLKLPSRVRGANTRIYLRLGSRARCTRVKGTKCRAKTRAKPTKLVYIGEVGPRR